MNWPVDISKTVLRTERLILRPWQETDLDDFYEYARVDGVGQMAGWMPHESREVSREILEKFIAGKKTFALEYQGKVIGSLGVERYSEELFQELDELHGRELGFVLSKDYWGRGLMPEAVTAVRNWLFETVRLDFLIIAHFSWNRQSERVIQKCGGIPVKTATHETRYGTKEETIEYLIRNPEKQPYGSF